MAMMVISDIDETIKDFYEYAKWEEKHLELAKYVENHLDQIDQFSVDTLDDMLNYLVEAEVYKIDESKERIFNSSPETWKNIDNPLFIKIVQSFYLERRMYDEKIDNNIIYRRPISTEENYQIMINADSWDIKEVVATLQMWIPTRKVQLYFDYSAYRSQELFYIAREWQQKSEQLKFIMGITDDELKEYLNKQNRTGEPVTDGQLLGTWTSTSAMGNIEESIEFRSDNSFVHNVVEYFNSPNFTGKVIITGTMKGTWHLDGDSLYRDYESNDWVLDRNNIEYSDNNKEFVEKEMFYYEEYLASMNGQLKENGSKHRSNSAFIDSSGDKIELGKIIINEEGKEETSTSYMVRKK